MSTCIAIVQFSEEADTYKLRIGETILELPDTLAQEIEQAINSVSAFNVEHVLVARNLWAGKYECSPDIVEVGYE